MILGLDFGLTHLDAVLLDPATGGVRRAWALPRSPRDPVDEAAVARALEAGGLRAAATGPVARIAATGGRSRALSGVALGLPVRVVPEPEAIGRGGLALAGLERALVVSCGTGTAMVAADAAPGGRRDAAPGGEPGGSFTHVTGSAVGGGTLLGLARHLLGTADAEEVAALAAAGDPAGVDATLGDVLGGGVGALPPEATAVNLGRLAELEAPGREDLAAGLAVMVGQVIAVIALNAMRANGLERAVLIGRLAGLPAVREAALGVWRVYGVTPGPALPASGGSATALGAARALLGAPPAAPPAGS